MKLLVSLVLVVHLFFPIHQKFTKKAASLDLVSENYILYSVDTGMVVFERNNDIQLKPASILKVLTTITALDMLDSEALDDVIIVDPKILNRVAPSSSKAGFLPYQKLTVKDVLYGIMLPSGADATALISYYLAEGELDFVRSMNEKAKALGMQNTQVANTSGLDHSQQHTTLDDLLILLRYALQNETFVEIYTQTQYTLTHDSNFVMQDRVLSQAHSLYDYHYLLGAKSGFTYLARRSLSSVASNDNSTYIFISTQANPQLDINIPNEALKDAIKVYDYMFENFVVTNIDVIEYPKVNFKRKIFSQTIEIPSLQVLLPQTMDPNEIVHVYEFNSDLKVPIAKDTVIGQHKLYYDDELLGTVDLLINEKLGIDPLYYGAWGIGTLTAMLVLVVVIKRKQRS
jgi:D-alanyl-D-alanine carboxypeptidase (penicillin-binding protein 5/6)